MSAVTIDVQDFADPNFNPKKWINSVLKTSDGDEGAKNTTIIVTKLEMASEATSRQFDQLSNQIIKSMPLIMYDLKAISDTAKNTHKHVETVRKELGSVEGNTETVIDNLHRPHIAKARMEECRMVLLEKSNHLNKIREEQERKKAEAEAAARVEEAAAAAAAAEEEEEKEKKRRLLEEKALAEQEERERLLKEEKEQALLKEQEKYKKEEEEKAKQPIDELSEPEEEEEEDDDDYGHVQLPPLRQLEPKTTTTTLQQLNARNQPTEENNSYLQQVTPQVSSVFKRIGVPLDKFWQS